jgi:hypothetical protein
MSESAANMHCCIREGHGGRRLHALRFGGNNHILLGCEVEGDQRGCCTRVESMPIPRSVEVLGSVWFAEMKERSNL